MAHHGGASIDFAEWSAVTDVADYQRVRPHRWFEDVIALATGAFLLSWGMVLLKAIGGVSGGIAGVSFLISYTWSVPLGLVFFIVNAPFYYLAVRRMGWMFTVKTLAAVSLISLGASLHHRFIDLDQVDPLYGAVAAGLSIGMGMLVLFRHGASAGGFGILAAYLQERYRIRAGYVQGALDLIVVGVSVALVEPWILVCSLVGVVVLNLVIAINHVPGRYFGTKPRAARGTEVDPAGHAHAGHEHGGEQPDDGATFWERRYAGRDQVWSGKPNQTMVAYAERLVPGTAIELACGEGADAMWLAAKGWQVTGVDISATAVARATEHAASLGLAGTTFVAADAEAWEPAAPASLVLSCFMHSPAPLARLEVLRKAATWVEPGGHLLVVSHAEPPPWACGLSAHHRELVGGAEEAKRLELGPEWTIVEATTVERQAKDPDGNPVTMRDGVVLARRSE